MIMDPITEAGILLSKLMRVVTGAIIRLNQRLLDYLKKRVEDL